MAVWTDVTLMQIDFRAADRGVTILQVHSALP
jgi:hypothetical protein